MPSRLAAYDPQLEIFEGDMVAVAPRRAGSLGEMQEMAFAADLLELRDARDLQAFVERLGARVARTMGQERASPAVHAVRRLLTAMLGRAMRRARVAGASAVVAPGLGERLAALPGHSLGLELEGLSEEDRRFETARQLVRLVADAAARALSPSRLEPWRAARAAAFAAARRHAPGMTAGGPPAAARAQPDFQDRPKPGPFRLRPVPGPAGG